MTAPHSRTAPEVDQALRPAGLGFAQTLDIAERRGIGAGIVVGKGGVITQTHAQGQLNGSHAGLIGSSDALGGSP
ncbi:hypothetical protein D9M69_699310 [compost metagenome]